MVNVKAPNFKSYNFNKIIGKYNLRTDFICNEIMGHGEIINRAFMGEAVTISNFTPPVQPLVDMGAVKEKPYESVLLEAHLSPVADGRRLLFVVCVFIVKSIFRGRPEVARAKEYLSRNWRGEFDKRETADALGLSTAKLYRLFKQFDDSTPGEYHQQCKIEHLKEQLADKNMTVKEAFKACGENHKGWIAKVFKEYTGLTPTQYRNGR